MKTKPRRFTAEFKLEAVRLVQAGKKPVSQIARELGVARQELYNWVRLAERRKGDPPTDVFPGHGRRAAADAEIARLRRELEQAKEDNDILKKAAAFFAKNTR
jgi:transposase-like protein